MAGQAGDDLKTEISGSILLATLDRPATLNALTVAMRAKFSEGLWAAARDAQVYAVVIQSASEKAFSSGADVREIISLARTAPAAAQATFAAEYAMNWQCECFSKPTVPLINGLVMGGGVGMTQFGTHRVAGEGYRFAMPETQIGLFPDVGAAHVFAGLPRHMGLYLGLTGRAIGRADAFSLGLVTHCIGSHHFEAIKGELAEAWPVDPALDDRHEDPGDGELTPYAEIIEQCFSGETVEDIIARLESVRGLFAVWATEVAAELRRRSPTALKVTHRHIRNAAKLDLRQTLQADYRLVLRALDGHDFHEGVRAALIDKDRTPVWKPARLEDVTGAMVDRYFAPLGEAELKLPSREEMQALRS